MAEVKLDISICSETGMGSFIVTQDGERVKADLMPDEVAELKSLAENDPAGIKAFIGNIDAGFVAKLDAFSDDELKQNILNPSCGI